MWDTSELQTIDPEVFPWGSKIVTFIRVAGDGKVAYAQTPAQKRNLCRSAVADDLIMAAWPGMWSQDIFVVDVPEALRRLP